MFANCPQCRFLVALDDGGGFPPRCPNCAMRFHADVPAAGSGASSKDADSEAAALPGGTEGGHGALPAQAATASPGDTAIATASTEAAAVDGDAADVADAAPAPPPPPPTIAARLSDYIPWRAKRQATAEGSSAPASWSTPAISAGSERHAPDNQVAVDGDPTTPLVPRDASVETAATGTIVAGELIQSITFPPMAAPIAPWADDDDTQREDALAPPAAAGQHDAIAGQPAATGIEAAANVEASGEAPHVENEGRVTAAASAPAPAADPAVAAPPATRNDAAEDGFDGATTDAASAEVAETAAPEPVASRDAAPATVPDTDASQTAADGSLATRPPQPVPPLALPVLPAIAARLPVVIPSATPAAPREPAAPRMAPAATHYVPRLRDPAAQQVPGVPVPAAPEAVMQVADATSTPADPAQARGTTQDESPAAPAAGDATPIVAATATSPARASASPSFARPVAVRAPVDRKRALLQRGAVAALTLLLALQLLLADRDALAAQARWRPLVSSLCGALGCTLPPWREPTAFQVVERDVRTHPQRRDALRVSARVRNNARWAQPWPVLRLTMSDVHGRAIASRAFQPREYLGGAPTKTGLSSGQTAALTMEILEPGPQAVAFTFDFE